MKFDRVGLGITTYKREDLLAKAVESVDEHLGDKLAFKVVSDDCTPGFDPSPLVDRGWAAIKSEVNSGIATSRANVLSAMVNETGVDLILLMEDDLIVKSPDLIERYVEAMNETGFHHLMYAHHGPLNREPVASGETVEAYPNCVGAFMAFTTESVRRIGQIDTAFGNALDHVNYTYRYSMARLTGPWGYFPDAIGSDELLGEQDPDLERSTIGASDIFTPGSDFQRSLRHWYRTWPMPSQLMRFIR